jgi:hypothetical protein
MDIHDGGGGGGGQASTSRTDVNVAWVQERDFFHDEFLNLCQDRTHASVCSGIM